MWYCKRKGHLVRYFIRSKKKMLSVHNPDAEEILGAGIIKSASRPANLRPNAEEILDAGIIKSASRPANRRPNAEKILDAGIIKPASRPAGSAFCKPRLMKSLSTWTQVPDSSKSAADGTERKDQICVLQTKTASESFTIRNILSERSKVQSPLASSHQTRASVINSGYQLKDCVQDRV